jgi:hypothetical protein
MNQTAFGEIGGVKKNAQFLYESNSRSPDAQYLEAIAKAGVDINYIVTGNRIIQKEARPLDDKVIFLNKKTGKPISMNELSDSLEMVRIELDRAREEVRRAQEIMGF